MFSMTGYVRSGEKFVGRIDDAPDVGDAVPALCGEDFRRLPAGGFERGDVGALEFHDHGVVGRTADVEGRRQVHARVRVDVELHVGREHDVVVRVRLREGRQAGAVEVDPVVVDEVRVLPRIHAARREPDLAGVLVHLDDAADGPFAPGDLVLHLSGDAVVQIEVVPAVALRHPDHFLAVGDVVAKALAGVAEEGPRLLGHDGARRAGRGVHLDDAEDLVAALVVVERDGRAVAAPLEPRLGVGVGEERRVNDDLRLRRDVEEHRQFDVEHVAGLGVLERRVLRLELVLRRRLDVVHVTAVSRA
jgi:hypothetical protein